MTDPIATAARLLREEADERSVSSDFSRRWRQARAAELRAAADEIEKYHVRTPATMAACLAPGAIVLVPKEATDAES